MPDFIPVPLDSEPVQLKSEDHNLILSWDFPDEFVSRLLRKDVPQRIERGACSLWIYREPGGAAVGLGCLDFCFDYEEITGGVAHPHIPLLSLAPGIDSKGKGYGTSIVRHLVSNAAIAVAGAPDVFYGAIFLEVYQASAGAIRLYHREEFVNLFDEPILDPEDGNKPYYIMSKRLTF
jgi:hypothetical protein